MVEMYDDRVKTRENKDGIKIEKQTELNKMKNCNREMKNNMQENRDWLKK